MNHVPPIDIVKNSRLVTVKIKILSVNKDLPVSLKNRVTPAVVMEKRHLLKMARDSDSVVFIVSLEGVDGVSSSCCLVVSLD